MNKILTVASNVMKVKEIRDNLYKSSASEVASSAVKTGFH
jgi:cation transport regulator ChaB